MALRDRWLTAIVRCSSRIYTHKKALLTARGFGFVFEIVFLLIDEAILSVLALPLLLVSSGSQSLLDLPTFRVRRAISISVLAILTAVWMVKSFIVVGREYLISHEAYFSVRAAGSVAVSARNENIPSGSATPALLPPPEISAVRSSHRTLLAISGTGSPGEKARIFIEERGFPRSVIFATDVGPDGVWNMVFRDGYTVPAGTYHITAILEDEAGGSTSIPSRTVVWAAQPSPADSLRLYAGKAFDFLVLAAVSIAVLITFLTVS